MLLGTQALRPTQWVGGMGIILFTIAILPLLGIGGMQLFKAEVPGPVADKVAPRLVETARRLWLIYVGFTLAETGALVIAGVGPFEALCDAFTTLATGGFSTRDLSVGAFGSPVVEWIVTVFMLCAGITFVVRSVKYAGRRVPEEVLAGIWAFFTAYLIILFAGAAVLTGYGYDLGTSFSAALTAVGNVGPGLGEVGAYDNFAPLPDVPKLVLACCMLAGRLELFTLVVLVVPRFWRR